MQFSGTGDASVGLNATPGWVALVEVKLGQHLALDLRYVEEQYQRNANSSRLDASHFDAGVSAIY